LLSAALVIGSLWWLAIALGAGQLSDWLNFEQAIPQSEGRRVLLLVGPWVAIALVNGCLAALPRALEQFGVLAFLGTVHSVALWVGAIVLSSISKDLEPLILLGIALQLILFGAVAAVQRKTIGQWPVPALRFRTLARTSRFSLASFSGSVASLATYHADKALVSAFLGPAAAGLYTAVSGVANKLIGLIAALAAATYPRVSALHAAGNQLSVAGLYSIASRMLVTLSVALGVIGIALAERFLTLWLGTNVSADLVTAFRLLIGGYVLASTSVVASNVLSGQGNARRGAWFAAMGGVITVLAGVLLIPRFGLVGAGLACVIGMAQAVAFDAWVARELRESSRDPLLVARRPWVGWLVAGLVTGLTAWIAVRELPGWVGLLASGALAAGAWIAVWFVAGFASVEERLVVARVIRAITGGEDGRKGT
jgi:O-antigen/teichoic acid export membrane protein